LLTTSLIWLKDIKGMFFQLPLFLLSSFPNEIGVDFTDCLLKPVLELEWAKWWIRSFEAENRPDTDLLMPGSSSNKHSWLGGLCWLKGFWNRPPPPPPLFDIKGFTQAPLVSLKLRPSVLPSQLYTWNEVPRIIKVREEWRDQVLQPLPLI
jgi:hypothetical protein